MISAPVSPGISVRCRNGKHCHNKPGCRCNSSQCSCLCHVSQPPVIRKPMGVSGESTAMVKAVLPKRSGKAKARKIHVLGCSKKPCVCSDIRAGQAAKAIVVNLGRLFVQALLSPPSAPKKESFADDMARREKEALDYNSIPRPKEEPAGDETE